MYEKNLTSTMTFVYIFFQVIWIFLICHFWVHYVRTGLYIIPIKIKCNKWANILQWCIDKWNLDTPRFKDVLCDMFFNIIFTFLSYFRRFFIICWYMYMPGAIFLYNIHEKKYKKILIWIDILYIPDLVVPRRLIQIIYDNILIPYRIWSFVTGLKEIESSRALD